MGLNINSTIGELKDNPDAWAILEKYLPEQIVTSKNLIAMGAGLTIQQIAPAAGGMITDDVIQSITEELEALGA